MSVIFLHLTERTNDQHWTLDYLWIMCVIENSKYYAKEPFRVTTPQPLHTDSPSQICPQLWAEQQLRKS